MKKDCIHVQKMFTMPHLHSDNKIRVLNVCVKAEDKGRGEFSLIKEKGISYFLIK